MNRLIVAGLLLTGCWDFDTARENCETVGACHFAPEEDGGVDDAGAEPEPEPERPGDVCETDAGLLCWEMPAMGRQALVWLIGDAVTHRRRVVG